jgi:hypothetical protein
LAQNAHKSGFLMAKNTPKTAKNPVSKPKLCHMPQFLGENYHFCIIMMLISR